LFPLVTQEDISILIHEELLSIDLHLSEQKHQLLSIDLTGLLAPRHPMDRRLRCNIKIKHLKYRKCKIATLKKFPPQHRMHVSCNISQTFKNIYCNTMRYPLQHPKSLPQHQDIPIATSPPGAPLPQPLFLLCNLPELPAMAATRSSSGSWQGEAVGERGRRGAAP
jgi:hypothetical protein